MATLFSPSQHTSKIFWDNTIARQLGLPPPQHRLVDFVHGRREVPMKLLCLGYSRTGTFSLLNALQKLGYNAYHMAEAMKNPDIDFPCWEQAIRQKYIDKTWEGREWGRLEFDKLLGRHDGVLDVPCILFAEELLKVYPEAKVILTQRPVEGEPKDWLRSIGSSIGFVISWKLWHWVSWADPVVVGPWHHFMQTTEDVIGWTDAGTSHDSKPRDVYNEHYEHIRKICPKERLLEFKFGMGWEELCGFLGTEVPEGSYPKLNDQAFFIGVQTDMLNRAMWMAVNKVLGTVALTAAAAGAIWFFRAI